jgi:tRNA G10  N-methylase Trm11
MNLAYFHKFPASTCCDMDYRDITLPQFSVIARESPYGRSDLADLTAIRPYQARYVMFGPPVLADCTVDLSRFVRHGCIVIFVRFLVK